MEAQIFKALGDPLRLKIVARLSRGSSFTLGEITTGLGISRQGVRKQVGVLEAAKIVRLTPHGRETRVKLDVEALRRGKTLIEKLEGQWETRLENLKKFVEEK